MGLFYGLAGSTWKEDATLVGSETILQALAMAAGQNTDSQVAQTASPDEPASRRSSRPLLAVVDSRGRVRDWPVLQSWPYWRSAIALCSASTPAAHLRWLADSRVETIQTDGDRVDLPAALGELQRRHHVEVVRVDSGGTLNGAMIRAGLVDEISLLVEPSLIGGLSPRSVFRAPDLKSIEDVIRLRLMRVEALDDGVVWLRYEICR